MIGLGCAASSGRPAVPKPSIDVRPEALAGTWYVIESNFPMWGDGKKRDPQFHYRLLLDHDGLKIDDRVTYVEKGAAESIEGVDTPDPNDASHFTWRGKGILSLFTSEWYVVMTSPQGASAGDAWAVIYFSSTLATPEGVDIIARTPSLSKDTLGIVRKAIFDDPLLAPKAKGLKPVLR